MPRQPPSSASQLPPKTGGIIMAVFGVTLLFGAAVLPVAFGLPVYGIFDWLVSNTPVEIAVSQGNGQICLDTGCTTTTANYKVVANTERTFTATPGPNCQFDRFEATGGTSRLNPYKIVVGAPTFVHAFFVCGNTPPPTTTTAVTTPSANARRGYSVITLQNLRTSESQTSTGSGIPPPSGSCTVPITVQLGDQVQVMGYLFSETNSAWAYESLGAQTFAIKTGACGAPAPPGEDHTLATGTTKNIQSYEVVDVTFTITQQWVDWMNRLQGVGVQPSAYFAANIDNNGWYSSEVALHLPGQVPPNTTAATSSVVTTQSAATTPAQNTIISIQIAVKGGQGEICAGGDCTTSSKTELFSYGTPVTFSAYGDQANGYQFDHYEGPGGGTSYQVSFTENAVANGYVWAFFTKPTTTNTATTGTAQINVDLTIASGSGALCAGSACVNGGPGTTGTFAFHQGDHITFQATPESSGWIFNHYEITGGASVSTNPWATTIWDDISVTVFFAPVTTTNTETTGTGTAPWTCTNGRAWDPNTQSCACPSGSQWDDSQQWCRVGPTCNGGRTWDSQAQACACPTGQAWDSTLQHCATTPILPFDQLLTLTRIVMAIVGVALLGAGIAVVTTATPTQGYYRGRRRA